MHLPTIAWYSARTKPKHEHIATANVRKNLGLEVFFPRFRTEKMTSRGIARVVEPLFPCYIFIRCVVAESMNAIQYTSGINRLVQFGDKIPHVPDPIILGRPTPVEVDRHAITLNRNILTSLPSLMAGPERREILSA
jgi:transcription antitermination factor NusG